jgi:hypothetical protein
MMQPTTTTMTALFFLFVLFATVTAHTPTGGRVFVTERGVNYIQGVLTPVIQAAATSATIPDMGVAVGSPIGKIDVSLRHIKVTALKIGATHARLQTGPAGAGAAIAASASGIEVVLAMDWAYRQEAWPHISGSGSAVDTAKITAATLTEAVGLDTAAATGRPTIKTTGCAVDIASISIKVTSGGAAAWFYQILVDVFAPLLKDAISSAACQ